jgi:hypothetical protein
MSVNSFFSLDRAVNIRSEEAGFANPELFDLCQISQDQNLDCKTSNGGTQFRVRYVRTRPGFFYQYFSLISGNEVSLTLIINDGTLECD